MNPSPIHKQKDKTLIVMFFMIGFLGFGLLFLGSASQMPIINDGTSEIVYIKLVF